MTLTSNDAEERDSRQAPAIRSESPGRSVVEQVVATLTSERDRLTRWTRRAMLLEALALAALGAGGLWTIAHSVDAATVNAVGFRLGTAQYVILVITALVIVGALAGPRKALPLVAISKAGFYICLFIVFGTMSADGGDWQLNAAGALLIGGVFIAGFAEFVLLSAATFDPDPGSIP